MKKNTLVLRSAISLSAIVYWLVPFTFVEPSTVLRYIYFICVLIRFAEKVLLLLHFYCVDKLVTCFEIGHFIFSCTKCSQDGNNEIYHAIKRLIQVTHSSILFRRIDLDSIVIKSRLRRYHLVEYKKNDANWDSVS